MSTSADSTESSSDTLTALAAEKSRAEIDQVKAATRKIDLEASDLQRPLFRSFRLWNPIVSGAVVAMIALSLNQFSRQQAALEISKLETRIDALKSQQADNAKSHADSDAKQSAALITANANFERERESKVALEAANTRLRDTDESRLRTLVSVFGLLQKPGLGMPEVTRSLRQEEEQRAKMNESIELVSSREGDIAGLVWSTLLGPEKQRLSRLSQDELKKALSIFERSVQEAVTLLERELSAAKVIPPLPSPERGQSQRPPTPQPTAKAPKLSRR